MSANKNDILLIRKYLNGELDERAMFELERRAEADPFLWDMMRGMEMGSTADQPILDGIDMLIDQRVEKDKRRVIPMWTIASIAASLLIVLGIGGWLFTRQPKETVALNANKTAVPAKADTEKIAATKPSLPIAKQPAIAKLSRSKHQYHAPAYSADKSVPTLATASIKADTAEYRASAYKVRQNANVDELLKKMNGFKVGADGSVTHQGQAITKAKLNGKTYSGGDVNTALKNLPADVVDKVQVIDDYGNQTSTNSNRAIVGPSNKSLNIATNNIVIGTVIDKNGKPLPGSIVKVNGTQNTTIADANGVFKIPVPPLSQISVTQIGYAPQQVKVNNNTDKLNITLSENSKALAEVSINAPIAAFKKTESAAASATIEAKDLKESQPQAIDQALQGRVAGVSVQSGSKLKSVNVNRVIKGIVTDKSDGGALPGVAIHVKDNSTGVVTDANGKFTITVPPNSETLVVNFIGYVSQQVNIKNNTDLKIVLAPSSNSLSEVVVVGYGDRTPAEHVYRTAQPSVGWDDYDKYIKDNATMPNGATGVVRLAFTVNAKGKISNIIIKKGQTPEMNKKAIDLLNNGPAWVGDEDGKPKTKSLRIKLHK